jgi:hypothetical protein
MNAIEMAIQSLEGFCEILYIRKQSKKKYIAAQLAIDALKQELENKNWKGLTSEEFDPKHNYSYNWVTGAHWAATLLKERNKPSR